jgi:hypothetical protein
MPSNPYVAGGVFGIAVAEEVVGGTEIDALVGKVATA